MGEEGYRQFLYDKSPSIVEVFNGYQPPTAGDAATGPLEVGRVVHGTTDPNLEIIPSRFDFSDNLISAVRPDERVLARLIANHFQEKDLIIIDCAPTESILTRAAYHASRRILVPVRPEYFATIGFPLLKDSLEDFRRRNRGHRIDVLGVVVNNAFYHGGNDGGPEKERAMNEILEEAGENEWDVFDNELPHSRGYPKMMRGDYTYLGNAPTGFQPVADEFFELLPGS
jgi:chromosome partitioning protein